MTVLREKKNLCIQGGVILLLFLVFFSSGRFYGSYSSVSAYSFGLALLGMGLLCFGLFQEVTRSQWSQGLSPYVYVYACVFSFAGFLGICLLLHPAWELVLSFRHLAQKAHLPQGAPLSPFLITYIGEGFFVFIRIVAVSILVGGISLWFLVLSLRKSSYLYLLSAVSLPVVILCIFSLIIDRLMIFSAMLGRGFIFSDFALLPVHCLVLALLLAVSFLVQSLRASKSPLEISSIEKNRRCCLSRQEACPVYSISLGTWLLALVMLHAYTAYSMGLVSWFVPGFSSSREGIWWIIVLGVLTFVAPLLILLVTGVRRSLRVLKVVAFLLAVGCAGEVLLIVTYLTR